MTTEPLRVGQRVRSTKHGRCGDVDGRIDRERVSVFYDGQAFPAIVLESDLEPLPTDAAGEGKENK